VRLRASGFGKERQGGPKDKKAFEKSLKGSWPVGKTDPPVSPSTDTKVWEGKHRTKNGNENEGRTLTFKIKSQKSDSPEEGKRGGKYGDSWKGAKQN